MNHVKVSFSLFFFCFSCLIFNIVFELGIVMDGSEGTWRV
jgi:hypothetical protein